MKTIRFFVITSFIISIIAFIYSCIPHAGKYVRAKLSSQLEVDSTNIPFKNKQLLIFAEKHGKQISPTYKTAVCTEYLIKVLENFIVLNNKSKSEIRIITDKNIDELLSQNSDITKGVYTALINSGQGIPINDIKNVKAGDLVQFWNNDFKNTVGHCGIVRAINLKKGIISMYSSTPKTNGHGIQTYIIPNYIFFVRLK